MCFWPKEDLQLASESNKPYETNQKTNTLIPKTESMKNVNEKKNTWKNTSWKCCYVMIYCVFKSLLDKRRYKTHK